MNEPLYLDPHLIVANKPANLLAVPGRAPEEADCLSARITARWPDALVVHRLDMATSGLMLFARGKPAQRALSIAFEARRITKGYVAVVHGVVQADAGVVDAPLAVDWPNRPRQCIDPVQGRAALTRWRVLARDRAAGRSRLALEPVTGRAHQLRVHMLSIGHPIVGDPLYRLHDGSPAAAAGPGEPRLLLHAEQLAFAHPADGKPMHLRCAAPF